MWKRALASAAAAVHQRPPPLCRHFSASASAAAAVDSLLLRALKEHYLEVSKMTPPPKVNPPSPYTIVKGALERDGPVLRRQHKDGAEEVSISVMRLANIMPAGADDDGGANDDNINQLFLHVDVSKAGNRESLHFLCGLYPDAIGIHSVCLRPKEDDSSEPKSKPKSISKYQGRVFQDLDEKLRDAFHTFLEARGVNENLFPFLQAWLYVKDHRSLMYWFKNVGTFINERKPT